MKKIVGYTSGVFDLLHTGHSNFIKSCQALCDELIIGIDSDQRVKKKKGAHRPIQSHNIRLIMVSKLNDNVFLKELESSSYLAKINPSIIFISEDHKHKTEILRKNHPDKKIIEIPYTNNISTTLLISKNFHSHNIKPHRLIFCHGMNFNRFTRGIYCLTGRKFIRRNSDSQDR